MRKKVISVLILFLYLAGVVIFALPDLNSLRHTAAVREVTETFGEKARGSEGEPASDLEELRQQMEAYNKEIYEERQAGLTDPWAYESEGVDLTEYGLEENVAAVITIPAMDVELPVYLGATQENMAKGAVQLGQTSMPVGGENTNCVIAAHRGYRGIPMFRDIELLKPGDEITVENLWETLTYRVTEIRILYPSDIGEVLIQDGKDMITLLTCHPYTQHSRRYAVFCEREGQIPDSAKDASVSWQVREAAAAEDGEELETERLLRKGGYLILIVTGAAIAGNFCLRRRKQHGKPGRKRNRKPTS